MEELIGLLVALGWIGISFLAARKKVADVTPAQPAPRRGKPAMEHVEATEGVEERGTSYTAPYFSYETLSEEGNGREASWRSQAMGQSTAVTVDAREPILVDGEQFDLRKAFIYQTILHNDFITDWK